jgi:hypothetical protein
MVQGAVGLYVAEIFASGWWKGVGRGRELGIWVVKRRCGASSIAGCGLALKDCQGSVDHGKSNVCMRRAALLAVGRLSKTDWEASALERATPACEIAALLAKTDWGASAIEGATSACEKQHCWLWAGSPGLTGKRRP